MKNKSNCKVSKFWNIIRILKQKIDVYKRKKTPSSPLTNDKHVPRGIQMHTIRGEHALLKCLSGIERLYMIMIGFFGAQKNVYGTEGNDLRKVRAKSFTKFMFFLVLIFDIKTAISARELAPRQKMSTIIPRLDRLASGGLGSCVAVKRRYLSLFIRPSLYSELAPTRVWIWKFDNR